MVSSVDGCSVADVNGLAGSIGGCVCVSVCVRV